MLQQIPQPPSELFLGNVRLIDQKARIHSFQQLAEQYGPIYKLDLRGSSVIVVSSQELVNEVCDEKRFSKALPGSLRFVREFSGDGLFTAENEEPNWAVAHRILMPTFGPKAIQDMFDKMVDIAEQLCIKWERMGNSNVIDIVDNMTRLTLDTIALCAFNYRFNSFYQVEMHPFVNAMVEALTEAGAKVYKPKIVDKLMVKTNRKHRENIELMHSIADDLIRERKEHPNDVNDLLNRMLNGRDPVSGQGLSDENIRYQMVTFLIAGHETTSGMLSFALYELSKHPEYLRRAQQEVDSVVGTGPITVKDLSKFVYLDQILKEALRLWPTAPAFALSCKEPQVIGGKYQINPSDRVLVLLPALHRDKKVWGEDANSFNPDHISPEKFASLPKNSWKPFGNGARACIGRPFAWQEALLVLAMVLQRFEVIDHDPHYKMEVKETLTIKPHGLFLRMNVRSTWIHRTVTPTIPTTSSGTKEVYSTNKENTIASSKEPLLILFGSNSGTCETFANILQEQALSRGFQPSLSHLNSYSGHLPLDSPILIVTASYEGQPTEDAKQFVTWLEQVPSKGLTGVRYSVFGCGHTDWIDTYQRIPKFIDNKLEEAGASRIVDRGEANVAQDMFADFDAWTKILWPALAPDMQHGASKTEEKENSLGVDIIRGSRDTLLRLKNLQPGEILENKELVSGVLEDGITSRSKIHIKVRLPDKMSYRAGDYLAVLPINSMDIVNKALRQFNLGHDDQVILQKTGNSHSMLAFPSDKPISVVELFMNYFELSQPASNRQLQTLIDSAEDVLEKEKLIALASAATSVPSVLSLLEEYKTCKLSLATFLEILQPMRVRQYSISSSPLWSQEKCTITVGILSSPSKFGKGKFEGVASNFLAHCLPGVHVSLVVRPSSFKLPEDPSSPIIMVGAGTGIAPFRGFVQERAALLNKGQSLGEALLFQGCRHPDQDYLYKHEFEEWSKLGAVQLRPVFSRIENHNGVKYVQHRIWECREEVGALLLKGAHVYVCGEGSSMAPAVKKTFADIYMEHAKCTQEEAERRMSAMDNRYSVDVFA